MPSSSSAYTKAPGQTVLKIRSGAPGQLETVTSAVNVTSTCTEQRLKLVSSTYLGRYLSVHFFDISVGTNFSA